MLSREENLTQGLKAGDPATQKAFYMEHVDVLCVWIRACGLRNEEDLQEIMSDIFMRAFIGIKKFEGRSKIKTWLFMLARRATVDYYRLKKNLSIQTDVDVGDTPNIFPVEGQFFKPAVDGDENRTVRRPMISRNGESHETATSERKEHVQRVLRQLSTIHQRVLTLRFINDLSIGDVSKILGKSSGAVKMMQLRAAESFKSIAENNQLFPELTAREK